MTTPDLSRSLGWAAVDWIEHYLIHGPGDVQGQRIELDDEFTEFIVRGYLLDAHGDRMVRRALLSRAKGRSNSRRWVRVVSTIGPMPARCHHGGTSTRRASRSAAR
jgi:hypothetical protein